MCRKPNESVKRESEVHLRVCVLWTPTVILRLWIRRKMSVDFAWNICGHFASCHELHVDSWRVRLNFQPVWSSDSPLILCLRNILSSRCWLVLNEKSGKEVELFLVWMAFILVFVNWFLAFVCKYLAFWTLNF